MQSSETAWHSVTVTALYLKPVSHSLLFICYWNCCYLLTIDLAKSKTSKHLEFYGIGLYRFYSKCSQVNNKFKTLSMKYNRIQTITSSGVRICIFTVSIVTVARVARPSGILTLPISPASDITSSTFIDFWNSNCDCKSKGMTLIWYVLETLVCQASIGRLDKHQFCLKKLL